MSSEAEQSIAQLSEEQHLLITLGEECGELITELTALQKAISKALRFGLDDSWRDGEFDGSPRELIHRELNDVVAVAELLAERGVLPFYPLHRELIDAKKAKVCGFAFDYARQHGTMKP